MNITRKLGSFIPSQSIALLWGMVGLTLALVWFSFQGATWLVLLLWCALAILWAILLRSGLTSLFGPVLVYDLIRQARRTRYFWIRLSYVFGLFLILNVTYLTQHDSYSSSDVSQSVRFVESFFFTFLLVQLVLVIMLVPAYVAGAITDEKEKKTIQYLLATDLHVHEIVLSKFLSRLGNVFLVMLAGMPILSFLQFIGGIDPELLLVGYLGTAITVLSLTGFSLFCSALVSRSRDAIVLGYVVVPLYLALDGALLWLSSYPGVAAFPSTTNWTSPITLGDVVQAFHAGNPFSAYDRLSQVASGRAGLIGETWWDVLRDYSLFHGTITLLMLGGGILGLRSSTIREGSVNKGKGRRLRRGWFVAGRPEVFSESPMLWKEMLAEGGIRWHWVMRGILVLGVVLSFVPAVSILIETDDTGFFTRRMLINGWVRFAGTTVAMLLLFAVTIRGASSFTGERERGTYDALILTNLTPSEILTGKWIGSVVGLRWGWVWLSSIWLLATFTGGLSVLAIPLLVIVWLIYASLFSLVGIWFSQKSRSTLRASVGAILTMLGLSVGHWLIWLCCLPMGGMGGSLEGLLQFQAGCTPPVVLAMLPMREFGNESRFVGYGIVGVMVWAGGSALMWAFNHERLRQTTETIERERR